MDELWIGPDEGARLRIESLEKFLARMFGEMYFCGVHHVHYRVGDMPIGGRDMAAYWCPNTDDGPCAVTTIS